MNKKLEPVGTVEDVRRRVEEYEARVVTEDAEHNSLSRDRAFLLVELDDVCSDATTAFDLLWRARNGFVQHLCIDGVPHGSEQDDSITCLRCEIEKFFYPAFYPTLPIEENSDVHFSIPRKYAYALATCIIATEGSSPNESEATPYLTKIMQACEAAEKQP